MMRTVKIEEAIQIAANEKSLEGIAIENLGESQVKAKDALLLARNGILIPEQNILYRDEDVKHDSEFDDYEWSELPKGISIDELSKISEEYETNNSKSVLKIEIELEDNEALVWAERNYPILKDMFKGIFNGFYQSKSLLEK